MPSAKFVFDVQPAPFSAERSVDSAVAPSAVGRFVATSLDVQRGGTSLPLPPDETEHAHPSPETLSVMAVEEAAAGASREELVELIASLARDLIALQPSVLEASPSSPLLSAEKQSHPFGSDNAAHLTPCDKPFARVASRANIDLREADDDDDGVDGGDDAVAMPTPPAPGGTVCHPDALTPLGDSVNSATLPKRHQSGGGLARHRNIPDHIGDVEVFGRIGNGSVGQVYVGLTPAGDEVAVKAVLRTDVRYMPNDVPVEAAVLRRVNHRNLARLYECIDDPTTDYVFYVMALVAPNPVPIALVDPETSNTVGSAVTPAELPAVTIQLLEALAHLRRRHIGHGDIRPDNILITRAVDGTPVATIIDFGGATLLPRRFALCLNDSGDGDVPVPMAHCTSTTRHAARGRGVALQALTHELSQTAASAMAVVSPMMAPSVPSSLHVPPPMMELANPAFSATETSTPTHQSFAFASTVCSSEHTSPNARAHSPGAASGGPGIMVEMPGSMDDVEDLEDADDEDDEGVAADDDDGGPLAVGSALRARRALSLSQTVPTRLRRQTIAVTMRSPSLGPGRNADTRRALQEDRRRALGKRTAQGGAIAFSAPEVLAGAPACSASDVWSLGVVLFALVYKRMPFHSSSRSVLEQAIVDGPDFPDHADMSDVQLAWRGVIGSMLEKEPFHRPSPIQLATDVASILSAQ